MTEPSDFGRLAAALREEKSTDSSEDLVPDLTPNIPGFQIQGLIASGGMGKVYEAQQVGSRRLVALKVMRQGVASRSSLRRFQNETETMARLNHSGIAQLYDSGTFNDGQGIAPYFAMELVPDARSITTFCREMELSIRQRLELFADVCDAVHHGHIKSIIHRDLKPANILIDKMGRPKIIDFGVARATDSEITRSTAMTEVGHIIGTLAYMSPEQCGVDLKNVDVTSDVYALGVVLYEFLCGCLPYDIAGKSHTQIARTIEEQQPRPPSELNRELRGDLDAILTKALAKEQSDRYQSTAEVAADIRRHLHREPIEARRPTAWQRAARWVGQHPIMMTSLSCMCIIGLSLVLTVGSTRFLLTHPSHIQFSSNGRSAQLQSIGGSLLKQWHANHRMSSRITHLIDGTGLYEGRRLLAVVHSFDDPSPHQRRMCVFDIDSSLDVPLWSAEITDADIPLSLRNDRLEFAGEQFDADYVSAIEIFEEFDGPELVVIFGHAPLSPRCLRIYSLENQLLYQIWHDGSLSPPVYLKDHNLLILGGDNKEVRWAKRGVDLDTYPTVVCMGLLATMDHIEREFLDTAPPFANQGTVVWYKALHPPDLARNFSGAKILPAIEESMRDDFARVDVFLDDQLLAGDKIGSVMFLLSHTGELLADSFIPSEPYVNLQEEGKAPDPRTLYLDDLPPIVTRDSDTRDDSSTD